MNPKSLNVSSKTHRFLLNKLKDKRTLQIYKKFEKNLNNYLDNKKKINNKYKIIKQEFSK